MPRSRTMKFFHTFYLLVIAVLATLLFVERQSQSTTPSNDQLSEQITELQNRMDEGFHAFSTHVDEQLNALEARFSAIPDSSPERTSTAPASSQQPPIDRLPTASTEPQQASDTPLTTDDYVRLGSAVLDDFEAKQAEFDMQSVDPEWAYPSSTHIHELFNQHPYLSQLTLAHVECRSSICQIDIDMQQPQSLNPARLLRAVNQLNQNPYGYEYSMLSRPLQQYYRILLLRLEPAAS